MTALTRITIATRESPLALWQAHHIQARLQALYPTLTVDLLGMTTQGDQILDRSLSKVGGKGLFVKELEQAMLAGEADLAVHSLKDVPMNLPDGFTLAAIAEREDPRDAFVSNDFASLADLPPGSVVGTSSLRRECQIRARYPHLQVTPLRGNLGTRLGKLDRGEYHAIILAAAGLLRLQQASRIRGYLSVEESLPTAGQGALGIECLTSRDDIIQLLAPLHHAETAACVTAERALARKLGGSCQVPLAAFATLAQGVLHLTGLVGEPDGSQTYRHQQHGPMHQAAELGEQLADALIAQGAADIITRLSAGAP